MIQILSVYMAEEFRMFTSKCLMVGILYNCSVILILLCISKNTVFPFNSRFYQGILRRPSRIFSRNKLKLIFL